jgi:hypothetical protein
MLSPEQWGSESNQDDRSDELCFGNDQLALGLVHRIEPGQRKRNVQCRPAAKHADAVLARRIRGQPPPRDRDGRGDRLHTIPHLRKPLPPQQVRSESRCQMRPMALAAQAIQRVKNLTHERPAAGHHRAHKNHLARQPLELLALDGLSALNVSELVENLLNTERIDANGHVHRVDNEAKNLHHLSG